MGKRPGRPATLSPSRSGNFATQRKIKKRKQAQADFLRLNFCLRFFPLPCRGSSLSIPINDLRDRLYYFIISIPPSIANRCRGFNSLPAVSISSAARHFPSPGHNVRGIHRLHSPLSSVYGVLGNNASYPCKEEIYSMPSEMEIDN